MDRDPVSADSEVRDGRTVIPDRIRRELDVADGDRLRWQLRPDGSVRVDVVSRGIEALLPSDPGDGPAATDVIDEHDTWTVE